MKMDLVAGSKNDEFYTPSYAVEPIIKYIKTPSTIWCPFDTDESQFVKMFRQNGNRVIATHISNNQDFFQLNIDCDYIIINPPYSLKSEVIQRLFDIKKPFAMLVGVVGLFESQRRFDMFKKNDFEILYLNRRVAYFKDYNDEKPSIHPPFSSVYICSGVLPKKICFEEIKRS